MSVVITPMIYLSDVSNKMISVQGVKGITTSFISLNLPEVSVEGGCLEIFELQ